MLNAKQNFKKLLWSLKLFTSIPKNVDVGIITFLHLHIRRVTIKALPMCFIHYWFSYFPPYNKIHLSVDILCSYLCTVISNSNNQMAHSPVSSYAFSVFISNYTSNADEQLTQVIVEWLTCKGLFREYCWPSAVLSYQTLCLWSYYVFSL